MSVLAKLPWVRRYALENERLRSKLNESRQQIKDLLESQERAAKDAEFLRQAREYEYYWREGAPASERNSVMADHRAILPGYFQSAGIELLAGRDFSIHDGPQSPNVIVVGSLLKNAASDSVIVLVRRSPANVTSPRMPIVRGT